MLLFKTAGDTFDSVIQNEKHAFFRIPKGWNQGEIVLISKNIKDCRPEEKQIQYISFLTTIRLTNNAEIETYWPENPDRWRYIAECHHTTLLKRPFNLQDALFGDIRIYKNITPAMKIHEGHEELITNYLRSNSGLAV